MAATPRKKRNTQEFIADAISVHGDTYDYSKVEYTATKDKVTIICKEHGEFRQQANFHLRGCGCPQCGKIRTAKSHEDNLDKYLPIFKAFHGDRYDYSKALYAGASKKIEIVCLSHGSFWQSPMDHRNHGCPKCGAEARAALNTFTQQQFIGKAVSVHGDRYDYSQVEYEKSVTKVKLICPDHGAFLIEANSHLQGKGCAKCSFSAAGDRSRYSLSDFLEKARLVHGDRYDYSLVDYSKSAIKVAIICATHGVFTQTPAMHLSGKGCRKCAADKARAKLIPTEEFIRRAIAVHGAKFNYDKTRLSSWSEKVIISCPVHGEFKQYPKRHLKGVGCRGCAIKAAGGSADDLNAFLDKAKAIHGEMYDYSSVVYEGSKTPIIILCTLHGAFTQTPNYHIQGGICPTCSSEGEGVKRINSAVLRGEKFIARASDVHARKYDYSKVAYVSSDTNVTIICPIHGEFGQRPLHHDRGIGCPKCGNEVGSAAIRLSTEDFISRAEKVHGSKFTYESVAYCGYKEPVQITCRIHGPFFQTPQSHLNGNGCQKCSNSGVSGAEQELSAYIQSLTPVKNNDRSTIPPKEIDCLLLEHKLGVEYCGLYYHSDEFKHPSYHLDKLKAMNDAGFGLIQIFEDEWLDKKEIVKSILASRLGVSAVKIFARHTAVREISASESRAFLSDNHIQGYVHAEARFGLEYKGKLVMVATFSTKRRVLGTMPENWFELVRLCSARNSNVIGGFSKLLKAFISTYSPSGIKTYCDLRLFSGVGYERVGFVKLHDSKPSFYYVKAQKKFSRYSFQKHKLPYLLPNFDPGATAEANMLKHGYFRIYDCGTRVYGLTL